MTKKTNLYLIIYIVLFFFIWTLYELFIKPIIAINFNEPLGEIIRSIFKILIWFIPCIYLLKKNNNNVYISLDNMFTNKIKWTNYLPLFIFFTIFLVVGSWVQYGNLSIKDTFQPHNLIGSFLLVGITEEMVFRGWLLNSFLTKMSPVLAIVINAFLFLAIHFPIYFYKGVLLEVIISGQFLQILILSIIFSLTFIKSKNLLVPIIFHMYWDLLTILFYT
ncbi:MULTISPECIES: type II CAAX endopeptidase family protein [unclassified Enterococcus]|uniref:CPBP family intramembrane glutamic endopeptidase n=1 Tax=unclassified Enterococcus TaxID=2608891 RepID=UPI0015561D1C|nr:MULTISPECIES: type II CAAX endopeptidase family protein [unclassified Enterococcus]MBS7577164.1 CPBP family intramembrane metalloprotease [Enterococcus sp. MMGLQ5-2]MBS7584389.1 CPBP family intramembrane metalloprotease [Enterococcus sp. MMGLQ5-1]NPD12244.1 CPBP family intramembrane metalloprotease [Enterococcus sp. MMGLQ5-1]NPD36998.1 CPBP family intramembrane metalloprotease [Enterococcus sp. MMGLQ5-2]